MATVGERLKKLRTNKGLTQKEFGSYFKLSESAVGMYERNERKPDIETIGKFADFFEVSTDYIHGRTDSPQSTKDADPEINHYFKGFKDAPEELKEEAANFWDYIKEREKGRKPGDRQGE